MKSIIGFTTVFIQTNLIYLLYYNILTMNKQILLILFVCATALLRGQTPTASFANWKDNKKAAYTIIHDDFSEYMSGIYQYADPIATARGIKFCFGAITSPDQCTPVEWAKARTMIGHGHECINHTHNHRCGGSASACSGQQTYGPADFSTELGLSSQIIEAPSGAGVKPLFFIHPYDAGSTAIDNYLTNIGYIGARGGTQATYNESNFTDFMHLNFYVYAPGTDIATLDAAVRTTIDAGGYALREFHDVHDVTNNAPSWGSMKLADYTNHLDYVKLQIDNGNLWSATASEVITYKMQRDAYQSEVVYTAATGQVNVNFSLKQGASINTSVLKTPVTVNVNLSTLPITNTYTVTQNNESVDFTRSANILSFNVYPHEGNVVINCSNCIPPSPIVGTITQPTCTTSTGSVELSGLPATGTWTINPGGITGIGTTKTVTGLAANTTYNFTVTNAAGATSAPATNAVIDAQPAIPTPPAIEGIAQPTCTVPTGTIVLGGLPTGDWTINPGNITGTGETKTFAGLNPGVYNYTVTNSVGCTSAQSGGVNLKAVSGAPAIPTIGTITQPVCASVLGTVVLSGLPAGNWIINPGNISGSGVTTTLSGLSPGTYSYNVKDVDGDCSSPYTGNIVINAIPNPPVITSPTVLHPGCPSPAAGTITVNATTTTGTLEYSIDGGANYQPSATFGGLNAGTYNIVVRIAGSTCTTTGSTEAINPAPIAPSVSESTVTQPDCPSPTGGKIVVNATTTVGTLEYSIDNGLNYQETPTFSNLSVGTYNIVVRRVNTLCTTTGNPVTIIAAPPAPSVSESTVTQPACPDPSTGTIVVNATTTIGTLEYSIDGGTNYQASATFSGLSAGTYNIVVRRVNTLCTTTGSPVIIETAPAPPSVSAPNVMQPGCPNPVGGTIEVVASTTVGTLEYSIDGGTTYQALPTFSGLSAGTYNIVVRRVNTLCTTTGSTVIIIAAPEAPSVSASNVTQPGCPNPTGGTIEVVASTTVGTLEYSIDGGTTYQASATFSGLSAGTYNIVVRRVNTLCTTTGNPVTINPAPLAPVVSEPTVTQPDCPSPATGTIVVNASTTVGALEYSIDGGTIYQATATFSGLSVGTYNIVVRRVGTLCTTTGSTVTISPAPTAPSISESTVTQPDCPTPAGGTIVVNASTTVGTLEYSIDGGTTYQASATFSGLSVGTYNVVVRRVGTLCITTGSPITIIAAPIAPSVSEPTVTQPDCPTPSGGTIVVNATTTTGTLEYSIDGGTTYQATATFSGLNLGTYNIVVRRVGTLCTTTGSTVTINPASTAPIVSEPTVIQPDCPSPAVGTIVVNASTTVGTLEYSIDGGTTYQALATFSGLSAGTYNIVVRRVGTLCTTTGSTVTINPVPVVPSVTESTVTQPDCPSPVGGTIVVNATTTAGTLEYSIDGGANYQTTATFSGLSAGTYNIVVRRVGTLCTTIGSPVTIIAAPPAPIISEPTVTQPDCPSPTTGTIVVNATTTVGTLEYSIDGGTNYQSSATFSGLSVGIYNIVVRRVGTLCTTTGSQVTISPAPPAPSVSTSTVTQPDCPTPIGGTIVVNASTTVGILEYSIDGGTTYQTSATFSALSVGTYNIVVRRIGTLCTTTGSPVTIIAAPPAPSVSASTVTQPDCPSPTTGTIVVNATTTIGTLEYSIDGGTTYQISATFSGLGVGTYNIVVRRVGTLCTTIGSPVTINSAALAPSVSAPTVTQPGCPSPVTGTIVVNATGSGTLEYSIDGGINYQSSATFSGLSAGSYTISVRAIGTACATTGSTVIINAVPTTPIVSAPTVTQPDCPSPSAGTIVVNATTTVGALEYSIDGGTSYQASATFSGLSAGTYNIVVRRIGTLCTATSSPVTIIAAPPAPTVSTSTVIQPDCPSPTTGTIVINATTTVGTLEYSIDGGTNYQSSATFSGLSIGTYNIVVRRVGTLCTATGSPVVINATPLAPSVSASTVTQPGCPNPATGTIVVNATTATGTLEYSINGGTSYQSSATFSGLTVGTYNIVVRRVGTLCITTGSTVTIDPAPSAPKITDATVIQPGCPSPLTGTIVVNATTVTGVLEYSINGGVTYQASATFSGLGVGSYTISARIIGTACEVIGETITINAAPGAPTVLIPTVTQPGCPSPATGTIVVNATGSGTLEYSIDGGINYQTSTTFSGLNSGSYTISARVVGTTCSTTGSTVIINPVPPTPIVSAPTVTQPDCPSPTGGIIVVNANTSVGTLEYSIDGGANYQAPATFSGLSAGTYNIVVRRVGTLCTTTGSTVTINPAPLAPTVSAPTVTQLGCPSPTTGTIVVNATTTIGTLEYSINGGTNYQPSATFSGLNAGTYNIVVRRVGTLCTTTGGTVTIDPAPTAPSVSAPTVTQPGCPSPLAGTIVVNATTAIGTLEYSINGGVSYQVSATFNDLEAGSYTIAVRRVGTLCITIGSTVTIDPAPIRPVVTASTVTQPACPSPSTGTIVVNATVTTGVLEYSINGGTSYQNTPTFSGLSVGTYAVVVRVIGTLCTTTGSAVTINPMPDAPSTPSAVIAQPTCTVALGSVSFSGLPASGTWTLSPGNITGTGTTISITGLTAGSYNYTVTNSAGCTSAPVNVVINAQPSTPGVPTVSNVIQPTCNLATGSVELGGLPVGSWTIMPGNVTGTGTTTTLSGLAVGTYNFTVTNSAGCTSSATASVVLTAATGCCSGSLPPTVTLTSPTNGSVAATNVVLSATASDPDGTISHVNFYWVTGLTKTGVISRILLNSDNTAPYSYTWENIVGGNYNVQAEAVDNCGKSTLSTTSNVNVLETFTVVITSPTNGQGFVPGSDLIVAASVIPYSSRTVAKVEFYTGNTKLGEDLTAPYTYLWTNIPAGNFTLMAKAIDNTGAAWSSPLYFISGLNALNRTQQNLGTNNNSELTMTASPNPASNQVILNTNISQDGDYSLSLTDLVGQVVVSKKVNYDKGKNTEVLDVSAFPKGIYIIRLVHKDGTSSVAQKLIID